MKPQIRTLVLVSGCALVPWFAATTGPGSLDPGFGEGGKVTTDFPLGSDGITDVAIQRNGKIVAVGFAGSDSAVTGDFAIARYTRDGSLDPTFGNGGVVTTDFFANRDEASAVALQRDGKLVVAGTARGGDTGPDFAVARYNRDGTLDATFGVGGIVTTDLSGGFDQATGVALQATGKIVVAGETRGAGTAGLDFALVRYDRDGSLDAGFGEGGVVTTDFAGGDDSAHAVALRPDGRIVAAGVTTGVGPRSDFALACYRRDGRPCHAFGQGGRVTTDFGGSDASTDVAHALAVLPNGRILVAGTAHNAATGMDFALAGYRSDGRLDRRFGAAGRVTTDFFGNLDVGRALALDSRGRILVGGSAFTAAGRDDFAVARYRSDGRLDERFGDGGKVTTDFFGGSDGARAVAVQRKRGIVAGGIALAAAPAKGLVQQTVFAVARYRSGKPRCEEVELTACLDEGVDVSTGRSRWVEEIAGAAAYLDRDGGFCGPRGYYYVARETGRIRVEVEVPRGGRYELRFRYRVGSAGQEDESVRVLAGGAKFDFRDSDLENTDRWEPSPALEVKLESGRQVIEFLSIGRDSVHLDEVMLEGGCEGD
jgi:uncharacterized delta-60 repeat protein